MNARDDRSAELFGTSSTPGTAAQRRPCSELFSAATTTTHPPGMTPSPGHALTSGAEGERRVLLSEVGRSLSSSGGRVLLIGEPGVGKSTVLAEVTRQAEATGALVIRGRPPSPSDPFSGLVDLLADVDETELDGVATAQRRVLRTLRAPETRLLELPDRTALRLVVMGLFRALQRSRFVVVSVDDWPRLDVESASLLRDLVTRATEGNGLSLVATQAVDARLSGRQPTIDRAIFLPGSVHVVRPLSVHGLADVLATWRGETLPPDQVASVYQAVGGNPSWAMELLDQSLGGLQATDFGPALPKSVADVALERVRRLPAPVLRVVAACAAMRGASAKTVIELSDTDCPTVIEATEEGVIAWRGEQLELAHPLLGAAALKVVGLRAQLELHARAAEAARDLGERACLLDRAALPGPDGIVVAALGAASEQAWAAGAIAPALAHACRALARTAPGSAEHARRSVAVAEVATASGWFDQAAAVLADLDSSSMELDLLDRALPVLVVALGARGDDLVGRILATWAEGVRQDSVRWAMVDVRRVSEGDPAPAREKRASRALDLMTGADVPGARHRALTLLLVARLDLGHGLDYAVLDHMRALEDELPNLALVDTADAVEGVHAYRVEEFEVSRHLLANLVERAESTNDPPTAAVFRTHLALVELTSGHQACAAALLEPSGGDLSPVPVPPPIAVEAMAALALARGDLEGLEQALAQPFAKKNALSEQVVRLVMRAAWAAAQDDWAGALPLLSEALQLTVEYGVDEPGRRLWLDAMLGRGLVTLDRLAEAEEIASRLEGLGSAGRRPAMRGHALRLRGLISAASGDLTTAQEQLHGAAQLMEEGQVPGDHARCLLDLGRVLRRRRARKECRRVLAQAAAIAHRTGDQPLLSLVERELGHSGRAATPDALTPAERRVALAAAQGLSNREIALECFVTVRTVETQLTSVYRKLGVRSRSQLVARLPADPRVTPNTG